MKRKFALFLVTTVSLAGCAKHGKPQIRNTYYCQKIVRQMHDAPHRYKSVSGNKALPTVQAKLQKEYRQYDCQRYDKLAY